MSMSRERKRRGYDIPALDGDERRTQTRRELLLEIDKALRSDGAAMHHSACWRNQGFGGALCDADYRSAGFMADFIQQRFKS